MIRIFILAIFILSGPISTRSQTVTQKIPEKARLLFLLDGSASMFGEWERTLKIRAARGILSELIDSLRADPNVELALRIYGHNSPPTDRNCEDTQLEVPFGPQNHDKIIETIKGLEPKGTTPIAYSLQQAAYDYPSGSDYRNIMIIITDGIESCGGDPCEVSKALQASGVLLRPFVIGMNMEEDYQKQFDCVGDYFDAKKIRDFRTALDLALTQSLAQTTVTVELRDLENRPTETNVNVSFLNSLTGLPVYEFVHFRDQNGRTDTIEIEPVLFYDVIANTIPPVVKSNVKIVGGTHNQIDLQTPQGDLRIEMPDHRRYPEGVKALIKRRNTKEVLHVQHVPGQQKYLVGKYDIEILTLPRIHLGDIEILHNKTITKKIANPGIVNLVSPSLIFGTIYTLDDEGKEEWVINLDTNETTTTLTLQPGNYKIAFRSKKTAGSKYTEIKTFRIQSRISTSINLFDK